MSNLIYLLQLTPSNIIIIYHGQLMYPRATHKTIVAEAPDELIAHTRLHYNNYWNLSITGKTIKVFEVYDTYRVKYEYLGNFCIKIGLKLLIKIKIKKHFET